MQKYVKAKQARRELDRKFAEGRISELRARPRSGWIRAVRGALGMSQAALAKRLGVTASAVYQLEQAEGTGGITLAKLSDVARALDTQLVYFFVPNSTFEQAVINRARRVATEQLGYVQATMVLENQGIGVTHQEELIDDYAERLITRGSIWD
jgi:predicted DNA-binding mobile mystery protein A